MDAAGCRHRPEASTLGNHRPGSDCLRRPRARV